MPFQDPLTNDRIVVVRKNDDLVAKKLVTFHSASDGTRVNFNMDEESDGSQRAVDLLPTFLDVSAPDSKKVYVIDEIDRSLHSLLTWQLINAYLECCHADSRSQLLLATHDLLLMDQSLFRRDEIWLTERNREGRSELFSLNDFEGIRNEKDVLESYLRGKFGGIPKLQLHHALVDRSKDS